MTKFFTIQNEGQKEIGNIFFTSTIHSLLKVVDQDGQFLFTQIKFTDGKKIRVRETLTNVHYKLVENENDDYNIARFTFWTEEEGNIPNDIISLFN